MLIAPKVDVSTQDSSAQRVAELSLVGRMDGNQYLLRPRNFVTRMTALMLTMCKMVALGVVGSVLFACMVGGVMFFAQTVVQAWQ